MNQPESLGAALLTLGGFVGLVVLTWNAFGTNMEFLVAGGVIAIVGILGLLVLGHRTWTREEQRERYRRFPGDTAETPPWTGKDLEDQPAEVIAATAKTR